MQGHFGVGSSEFGVGRETMIQINPKALLDDRQKKVIFNIQEHTFGHLLYVTRGHSRPLDQLRTIEQYAHAQNCLFSEFIHDNLLDKTKIWIKGIEKEVYLWQQTWAMLLHLYHTSNGKRGAKINPPFAAECLFDYVADGRNKIGEIISPSPHIKELDDHKPCPIDFSQRTDGRLLDGVMLGGVPNIKIVAQIMETAKAAGAGIRNITVEPANGCVHIDIDREVLK